MKVLVTGASGLIGSALLPELTTRNHEVVRLVRHRPAAGEVEWDPMYGVTRPDLLAGVDAVVHLAGENVAGGRWTERRKARIRDSRVTGTRLLCEAFAASPPRVWVGASAVGFYGDRGDEVLTEASGPGQGFLAETCVAWEQVSAGLDNRTRRVLVRIGIVLSLRGGALQRMLLPFSLGLGGRLGSGRQYMSWVALEDVVRILCLALEDDALAGPCNATAPEPVTNREFAATLGRVLHRPAVLPVPVLALRLALGEMAGGLLLASTRAVPQVLNERGFAFERPRLEGALGAVVGRGS